MGNLVYAREMVELAIEALQPFILAKDAEVEGMANDLWFIWNRLQSRIERNALITAAAASQQLIEAAKGKES